MANCSSARRRSHHRSASPRLAVAPSPTHAFGGSAFLPSLPLPPRRGPRSWGTGAGAHFPRGPSVFCWRRGLMMIMSMIFVSFENRFILFFIVLYQYMSSTKVINSIFKHARYPRHYMNLLYQTSHHHSLYLKNISGTNQSRRANCANSNLDHQINIQGT